MRLLIKMGLRLGLETSVGVDEMAQHCTVPRDQDAGHGDGLLPLMAIGGFMASMIFAVF
jgi:hypothetical protein